MCVLRWRYEQIRRCPVQHCFGGVVPSMHLYSSAPLISCSNTNRSYLDGHTLQLPQTFIKCCTWNLISNQFGKHKSRVSHLVALFCLFMILQHGCNKWFKQIWGHFSQVNYLAENVPTPYLHRTNLPGNWGIPCVMLVMTLNPKWTFGEGLIVQTTTS